MSIHASNKDTVIKRFQQHDGDTGSPQVQIALITHRINDLAEHFKAHKRDHHSRHGLLKLIGHRRQLLDYVKRSDQAGYRKLLDELELRK